MNIVINDISHQLEKHTVFTKSDLNELKKSITDMFEIYIIDNILDMYSPTFDTKLTNYIYDIHINQLMPIYKNTVKYRVAFKLKSLIRTIKNKLYTKVVPPRSYKCSFVRNILVNNAHLTKKIVFLQNLPLPAQRTDEWYVYRHNLLTASSIWKTFGTQASQNQLIYEKCLPITIYKNAPIDSPLHWGQKYEPVSVEFYKQLYNTEISDFGCIRHPQYSFIGASPDGIITDISNPRYGRMLEIKNIVNREINGIPKLEYWIQMQLQMETCDLNECDFLETKFVEYESEEQFLNDGSFTQSADDKKLKGIMILFSYDGRLHYEYAPLYITSENFTIWEQNMLNKNQTGEWIRTIFWKLEKYSNVLVLRNKVWFQEALSKIRDIWNIIEHERETGYAHRAPKKRKSANTNLVVNKCYITVDPENTR